MWSKVGSGGDVKLLERITKAIAAGKVEFWQNRPENLSRAEFEEVFSREPDLSKLKMDDRQSGGGVHGIDGEDYVYKGTITVSRFGQAKTFYLKFFFWKKDDPRGEQGIEVQSFKPQ